MRRTETLTDRIGFTWAELTWDGDTLERLAVPGATVIGERVHDDLLGDAHAIVGDRELTRISAIDWARPTEIPAIAAPGRLPPGAGGAIMNVLAILAERAGVPSLRYAGPYPTSALWRTLTRSFRTTATEAGRAANANAPVESNTRTPSTGKEARVAGREPLARIASSNS